MLDALVENKKTGSLIGGLDSKDFQLKEDGALQSISYFAQDRLPLSVVFLFDLTDTVRPILKPLAAGALTVLDHLKPEDEVAVMVFSSHTDLLQGFTQDHVLAAAAINKAADMKSGEATFIHEDMWEAVDESMKATLPQSRRVTVWLTDGTSNFENRLTRKVAGRGAPPQLHTKEEATAKLLHSGTVVAALIDRSALTSSLIAIGDASPFAILVGGRMGDINKYADLTGGPVLKITKTEVAEKLALLIDELRKRYTLGYKPNISKSEGTFCRLQLTLNATAYKNHPELKKSEILIRTKTGYYH